MRKNNPVRGQYLLVGTDLIKAGIRTINKVTALYREDDPAGMNAILTFDPATERWLTGGAVTKAVTEYHTHVQRNGLPNEVPYLDQIPVAAILPFLQSTWRAKVRTTEDMIVHMLGGETAEHRAYAKAQLTALTETYLAPAASQAA